MADNGRKVLRVPVSAEQHKRLKLAAITDDMTIQDYVSHVLGEELERRWPNESKSRASKSTARRTATRGAA